MRAHREAGRVLFATLSTEGLKFVRVDLGPTRGNQGRSSTPTQGRVLAYIHRERAGLKFPHGKARIVRAIHANTARRNTAGCAKGKAQ